MPREFSQVPTKPSSEQFVFPRMIPPAWRMRSRNAALFCGMWSLKMMDPLVVRMPAVIWLSLMGMGRPWSGPRWSPFMMAASAAFCLFDGDVVGYEEESVELVVDVFDALDEEFGQLDG